MTRSVCIFALFLLSLPFAAVVCFIPLQLKLHDAKSYHHFQLNTKSIAVTFTNVADIPMTTRIFSMLEGSNVEPTTSETVKAGKGDGTYYYDDEVEPLPSKGLSDSMKARLIREASSGLNAEEKQTNVLAIIIAVVAALVVLGGKGIFY